MAYIQTGFTPEEEQQLLATQQQHGSALTKLQAWTEGQDRLRIITTASLIVGFLYTLAKFGDLVSERRARKKLEVKLPQIGSMKTGGE